MAPFQLEKPIEIIPEKSPGVELLVLATKERLGDILVVRPTGWGWGKKECLPSFWIVKLPEIEKIDYLQTADVIKQDQTKQVEYLQGEVKPVSSKGPAPIKSTVEISSRVVDGKTYVTMEETRTVTVTRNASKYRIKQSILDTFSDKTVIELKGNNILDFIEDKSGIST